MRWGGRHNYSQTPSCLLNRCAKNYSVRLWFDDTVLRSSRLCFFVDTYNVSSGMLNATILYYYTILKTTQVKPSTSFQAMLLALSLDMSHVAVCFAILSLLSECIRSQAVLSLTRVVLTGWKLGSCKQSWLVLKWLDFKGNQTRCMHTADCAYVRHAYSGVFDCVFSASQSGRSICCWNCCPAMCTLLLRV